MMDVSLATVLLFGSLVFFVICGLPLVFSLGSVAMIFTFWLWGPPALMQLASTAFGTTLNIILIAVPLFVFMANVLQISGLADDLYQVFHVWSGRINGGLAIGTVFVCAIFAAMSGNSGAATVSMGVIAIPAMLKRNYDKFLAVGCVSAAGALGILIPPSIVMIIYSAFSGVSIGKLFIAGIIPGMLLTFMFAIWIFLKCLINPKLGPAIPLNERATFIEKLHSLKGIVLPAILIIVVLGSIFFGFATPTEAAALGAIGSLVCAFVKKKLDWNNFKEASKQAGLLSSMIIWIVIGASCFSNVYTAIGAPDFLNGFISGIGLKPYQVIIIIQLTYFLLGMFMDPTGIVMITTPIYIPLITHLGFDPVWFGILFVINMEMGYISPPFGYNLFYMRSIISNDVMSMKDIYLSVLPFLIIQFICLIIILIFPQIALWLPEFLASI